MMSVTKPVSAKLWAWYIMRGLRPMSPRTRMATERSECWFRGRKALHAKNAMHSRRSACTASSCGYVTMSGPLQAAARICDRSRRHRVRRHPVIRPRGGSRASSLLHPSTMASSSSLRCLARQTFRPSTARIQAYRAIRTFATSLPRQRTGPLTFQTSIRNHHEPLSLHASTSTACLLA